MRIMDVKAGDLVNTDIGQIVEVQCASDLLQYHEDGCMKKREWQEGHDFPIKITGKIGQVTHAEKGRVSLVIEMNKGGRKTPDDFDYVAFFCQSALLVTFRNGRRSA